MSVEGIKGVNLWAADPMLLDRMQISKVSDLLQSNGTANMPLMVLEPCNLPTIHYRIDGPYIWTNEHWGTWSIEGHVLMYGDGEAIVLVKGPWKGGKCQ